MLRPLQQGRGAAGGGDGEPFSLAGFLDRAEEFALRGLGLRPWEFLALTPRELLLLLEGRGQAEELTDIRLSWLISCWTEKVITAEDLRGAPLIYFKSEPKVATETDVLTAMRGISVEKINVAS